MKNAKSIIAAFAIAAIFTVQSNAQSIVDPGISVHNYKHPNKAAQAQASQNKVRVENLGTVERVGKYQRSKNMSTTPKYAPRPATLVVMQDYKKEGVQINPLTSPRNYKTQQPNIGGNSNQDTTEVADNINKSENSVYPTTD